MNSALTLLMRAAIAASITDREKFIDQMSTLIEQKIGSSPETAETLAEQIEAFAQGIDSQLFLQQLLGSSSAQADERIEKLTRRVETLAKEVASLKKAVHPAKTAPGKTTSAAAKPKAKSVKKPAGTASKPSKKAAK